MPPGADPLLDLVTRLLETHGLFVYGSLMPGLERWTVIADRVEDPQPASVPGRLWDTGFGYPAARFAADAPGAVEGVRVAVPPAGAEDLARRLLAVEGDLYEPRLVHASDGRPVTAFEWLGSVDGMRELAGTWP